MARQGTARAIELLHEISRETGIDVKSLKSDAIYNDLAMARRLFCQRGAAEGIPRMTLGAVINRDGTTVLYHVNAEFRARKQAASRRWIAENRKVACHAL